MDAGPRRLPEPLVPTFAATRTAWALLVAVILFWGVNWPVMKIGLRDIGPMSFAAARMGMAAVCMLAVLSALGRLHRPTPRDWPIVLSVGAVQMGVFVALTNFALLHVDAGRSAILAYTTPLWVVPGAVLFLGERLSGLRLAGFLCGMAGVAVLFAPGAIDWSDRAQLLGNGILMVAALVWAALMLHIKGHRWDSPPLELAPWQFLVATALLLPLALVVEGDTPIDWTTELAGVLVFNGPIATAFCFVAVVQINRTLPAITTSLSMLGVPAAGLGFAALLLGERIDFAKGVGLGLIASGVALVALGERRAAARA